MGSLTLLDTNILIYHANGRLSFPLGAGSFAISVISEIEVLGFNGLTDIESDRLRQLVADLTVVPINDEIKEMAIELRQTTSLRLPDAIIVATAIVIGAELMTNDSNLIKVPGLVTSVPALN